MGNLDITRSAPTDSVRFLEVCSKNSFYPRSMTEDKEELIQGLRKSTEIVSKSITEKGVKEMKAGKV